jgi:transposase
MMHNRFDLAKNVAQVHEADGTGRAVVRKKLQRTQVLVFCSQVRRGGRGAVIGACAGAGLRGSAIGKRGHQARLVAARLRRARR